MIASPSNGDTATLSRSLQNALPRISPSGAKTFIRCRRLWAYQYLDGIKDPQTASQRRGEIVHALLEAFLLSGEEPTVAKVGAVLEAMGGRWRDAGGGVQVWVPDELGAGPGANLAIHRHHVLKPGDPALVVQAARRLIVARGEDLRPRMTNPHNVERHIERATDYAIWHGYADVLSDRLCDMSRSEIDILDVDDWKTTSDIKRYAMTVEQLLEDVQALLYSFCLAGLTGQTNTRASWNYVQVKGACKTEIVSAVIETSRAEDAVGLLDEHVAAPISAMVRAGLRAVDVEPTGVETGACGQYAGCPRREICPLSPADRLRGLRVMTQNDRPTLFESLGGQTKQTHFAIEDFGPRGENPHGIFAPSPGQTEGGTIQMPIQITVQSGVQVCDMGELGGDINPAVEEHPLAARIADLVRDGSLMLALEAQPELADRLKNALTKATAKDTTPGDTLSHLLSWDSYPVAENDDGEPLYCSVCLEQAEGVQTASGQQRQTPAGPVCAHGHGGAPGRSFTDMVRSEPAPSKIPPGRYAGVNRSTQGPESGLVFLLRCSCRSGDDRDPRCEVGLGTGGHPVGLKRDVLCECEEHRERCPVGLALGPHGSGHDAEIVEWRDGIEPVTRAMLVAERAATENAAPATEELAVTVPQLHNGAMTNTTIPPSAPPATTMASSAQETPASELPSGGYILCLDCAPRGAATAPWGASVIDATGLLREAARMAASRPDIQYRAGAVDYRCAEFGAGPGLLVAAVTWLLDAVPARLPQHSIVTLDTRMPEAQQALAALVERAAMVIQ